jgi:hypothetical protein
MASFLVRVVGKKLRDGNRCMQCCPSVILLQSGYGPVRGDVVLDSRVGTISWGPTIQPSWGPTTQPGQPPGDDD